MGIGKMVLTTVTALALVSAPAWLQAEDDLPVVNAVKVFRTVDNEIAVEISADRKIEYTSYKMRDLLRIVVDIRGSEPVKPETVQRYKSITISNIWLEKKIVNGVPISRVSINLTDDADYRIQADSSDSTKLRVVLVQPPREAGPGTVAALPARDAQTSSSAKSAAAEREAKDVSGSAVVAAGKPLAVTGVDCKADAIDIVSSAGITRFKVFTLQKPGRLVIDIPGAKSALASLVLPANRFGITKARFASDGVRLRIVFDSAKEPFPDYDVVKTATGLRIVSM